MNWVSDFPFPYLYKGRTEGQSFEYDSFYFEKSNIFLSLKPHLLKAFWEKKRGEIGEKLSVLEPKKGEIIQKSKSTFFLKIIPHHFFLNQSNIAPKI